MPMLHLPLPLILQNMPTKTIWVVITGWKTFCHWIRNMKRANSTFLHFADNHIIKHLTIHKGLYCITILQFCRPSMGNLILNMTGKLTSNHSREMVIKFNIYVLSTIGFFGVMALFFLNINSIIKIAMQETSVHHIYHPHLCIHCKTCHSIKSHCHIASCCTEEINGCESSISGMHNQLWHMMNIPQSKSWQAKYHRNSLKCLWDSSLRCEWSNACNVMLWSTQVINTLDTGSEP